jgi:hypothetical protein
MSDETPGVCEGERGNRENDGGCAFVIDGAGVADGVGTGRGPGSVKFCSAPRQPGSAYCPRHHAFCHLSNGSAGERQRLREIEALAKAVGGTQGRAERHPSAQLLRRFDRLARVFPRPKSSLIVLIVVEDTDGDATDP